MEMVILNVYRLTEIRQTQADTNKRLNTKPKTYRDGKIHSDMHTQSNQYTQTHRN